MSQVKAYQPLNKIVEQSSTARDQYIAIQQAFDKGLSDIILDGADQTCSDLLETEDGSIINISGISEKSILRDIKKLANKLLDSIDNFGENFFNSIDENIDQFTTTICVTINSTIKTVFELLETLISAPILIIDELIKTLQKLADALNELGNILFNCVLDKVYQIQNFINNLVPRPGNLETISNMVDQCPQLYCFIVDFFKPICKGESFNNTQQLLECVRSKLTVPINDFFNDYAIQILKDLIKEFLDHVDKGREFLVKKIRNSIKKYIKLLYQKREVPSAIRWLLVTTNNCDGTDKASIMDYIYALRRLSVCLDTTCSSINSTIKRDIQELNQRLYISFDYWKRFGVGYDLFLLIEREERRKQLGEEARRQSVAESGTPSDNSISIKSVLESAKNEFDFEQRSETNIEEIKKNLRQDERKSLEDNGITLTNGDRLFRDGIEGDLVKIYQNLSQEIFIYEDKYNEYSEWDSDYLKDELNKEKKKINSLIQTTAAPEELSGQKQFLSTNSERTVVYQRAEESQYSSKYLGYKQLASDVNISREQDESDLDFYTRWYKSIVR